MLENLLHRSKKPATNGKRKRTGVYVGTPMGSWMCNDGYQQGMQLATELLRQYRFYAGRAYQTSLISLGRNMIIRDFIFHPEQPEWLLWIDSDVIFEASHVEALLSSGKDVVGGFYPMKEGIPRAFAKTIVAQLVEHDKVADVLEQLADARACSGVSPAHGSDEPIEVSRLPFGFCAVRRDVIQELWDREGSIFNRGGIDYRAICQDGPVNGHWAGEDAVFFSKVQEAGHKVYCHPAATVKHAGSIIIYDAEP